MKNKFIIVYTVFASLVFIFSISFFGYNLYNEYTTNYEKSNSKVKELVNNIRNISFTQTENDALYAQAIKKAIADPSDYSYIQVVRNNETVVLYPSGKSREECTSRLTKSFDKDFSDADHKITLYCNAYLIRPDSIFYYARISFLLILIITLITVIMIIYLNLTETSSDVISITENDQEASENEIYDEEYEDSDEIILEDDNEQINENPENEIAADSSSENNEESTEPVEASEPENVPEDTSTNAAEAAPENTETPVNTETIQKDESPAPSPITISAELPVEEVKPAEIKNEQTNDPAGLFNPDTGIGWESYLLTRLENEIDRATASEIDLSVFVIQLKNIKKDSSEFKNVCNYLALQFQFKDLLFEYKEDCIVAIKISMDVDSAITFADKLYTDTCNILNSKDCFIGISSRSIRMVTGKRILLEADQALEHAHEDADSPIIAFRVDTDKYRHLMEQNRQ